MSQWSRSAVGGGIRDLPARLGGYVLLRRVAASPTAELFVAADDRGGLVDLHLVRPSPEAEALMQAQVGLRHPDVAPVVDWGRAGAGLYLVEEHVAGVPVEMLLTRGRLPGPV